MDPANQTTVELPPLSFRADLVSVNEEKRTVDVVFTTGAPVTRFDWMSGTRYVETLSMDPAHVRLDRLNSGAPLLDTHSGYSLSDQIGVVEDGTAKMNGKRGLATVRFSKRDAVEPIWRDVQDKIITKISVGYLVHAYEETVNKKDGAIPTRKAIDWEPYELSFVPMPADPGAQTRDGKSQVRTHPCIITRGVEPADAQERAMPEENESQTIVERNPLDPGAPTEQQRSQTPPPAETDASLGAAAERERIQGITFAARAARMPAEFMDRLIGAGTPLVKAQAEIFDEMRKRGGDDAGPQVGAVRDVRLTGPDPLVHVRAGIQSALLHRLAPSHFALDDVGRNYRGMNLLDVGRAYLQARGTRVTDLTKNQLAAEALGLSNRGGMHTTSDFSNLLADVAAKTLRRAYAEQPQTFSPLVTKATLPDYKYVNLMQLGDAPALLEIKEHGEYTSGTIGEGKERYRLIKYGRKFAITREALINDDTNAFAQVPMAFGRRARILESDLVWAQITSNPIMGDGYALFSAQHSNLETDGDAISVASLGRARASLRTQRSVDGTYMNLGARYLLVPTTLETVADQFVTVVTPQQPGQANPFQGKLQVIAEPRLDAEPTAWYVAADGSQLDMIVVGYLEGEEGPQVESRVGFDVDGVEIKCRLDFGTKVVDWRGFHKDPGDDVS